MASNNSKDVHIQVLKDLAREYKMNGLEALPMGEKKFKELEKATPLLFRYIRALRPVFAGKEAVPKWVHDMRSSYLATQKYIANFIKMSQSMPLLTRIEPGDTGQIRTER